MITLIDNYDSFTYNLYHDLSKKDEVKVIKNDQIFKNLNKIINSKAVVLATGGGGHLFANTTNPTQASGEGISLGWRAGAVIESE